MPDIALLPDEYAVCQLPAGAPVPAGLLNGPPATGLVSVTRTGEHISIICPAARVPAGTSVDTSWRCLHVLDPVNQAVTGVLAALVAPLAEARVNVVVFSTYDTDYLLVPSVRLAEALAALNHAGHRVAT